MQPTRPRTAQEPKSYLLPGCSALQARRLHEYPITKDRQDRGYAGHIPLCIAFVVPIGAVTVEVLMEGWRAMRRRWSIGESAILSASVVAAF